MTYFEHLPFLENIPAYALGALDAKDAAALEAHLQTCASCRDELKAYRHTSDNLSMSVPPQEPSAALRKRLQSRLPSAHQRMRPRLNWSFSRVAVGPQVGGPRPPGGVSLCPPPVGLAGAGGVVSL